MTLKQLIATGFLIGMMSCNRTEELCTAYLCEEPLMIDIKIKYRDAATSQDLLFSANAPYQISDLTWSSSLYQQRIPLGIDSTNKSNRFILLSIPAASQTLTIKLADKPADTIKLETQHKDEGCCGKIEVIKFTLNQTTGCTSCSYIQPLTLLK